MGNGVVKLCAKCGKPTKKQFREACKACGHNRWAPPTADERCVLAQSTRGAGASYVNSVDDSGPAADESLDTDSVGDASPTHATKNSVTNVTNEDGSPALRGKTPPLDLTQLGLSSAFLNAGAKEAMKSPRPFDNRSRSDATGGSECTRVRIGPRRGTPSLPPTRNLREIQAILIQESPGRSRTMSRNRTHTRESKTSARGEERGGRNRGPRARVK